MQQRRNPIRILVVDDSPFMRTVLQAAFRKGPEFEVIGTAEDGVTALDTARRLRPHVITLDVEMPGMSDLDVLQTIMNGKSIPVVMVSTKTQRGAQTSLDAYAAGAIECIAKPVGQVGSTLESFCEDVRQAVCAAADSNPQSAGRIPPVPPAAAASPSASKLVIAIGVSAGGIVYGMPKAAADTGQVDIIVPLQGIPDALNRLFEPTVAQIR